MTRGRRIALVIVVAITLLGALFSLLVARDAGLAAVFLGCGAVGIAATVLASRGRRRGPQRDSRRR